MPTDDQLYVGPDPTLLITKVRDRAAALYGCDMTMPAMRKIFQALGEELQLAAVRARGYNRDPLADALGAFGELMRQAAVVS